MGPRGLLAAVRRGDRSGKLTRDRIDFDEILSDPFWSLIEADFLREYGIDLVDEFRRSERGLPAMSWRAFLVRLRGLGQYSAWRNYRIGVLHEREKTGTTVEDPVEGEALFRSAFGLPPMPGK